MKVIIIIEGVKHNKLYTKFILFIILNFRLEL